MTRILLIGTLAFSLFACNRESNTIFELNQIQTDWYSLNDEFIYFEDGVCFSNIVYSPYPSVSRFTLRNDTLKISTSPFLLKSTDTTRIESVFKIIDVNSRILFLRTITTPYKYFIFHNWQEFHKKRKAFHSLSFSSSPCFGSCPVQCYDIADKVLRYRGFENTKYRGNFKLILNDNQLERIQRKLAFIDKNGFGPDTPDASQFELKIDTVFFEGTIKNIPQGWAILYLENLQYFLPERLMIKDTSSVINGCLNQWSSVDTLIEEKYYNAP